MSDATEPTSAAAAPPAPQPLRGPELMRAVVNQILDHPATWRQDTWHCGTTHCVAGWSQIMGGRPQSDSRCHDDAKEMLGLTTLEADWLFAASRTIGQIHSFASAMLAGRDRDGYDRAGYDRDGRDRDGYDRAGYDRAGYDRDGRDRDGYDRAGYDRDGRDRDGYDRAGYDRAGGKLPRL